MARRHPFAYSSRSRGSGLVLALFVLVGFGLVALGLSWTARTTARDAQERRDRTRSFSGESLVMMTAAMHASAALETRLAVAQQGGFAEIDAAEVAGELQSRLLATLRSATIATAFSNNPVLLESVAVTYAALPVDSSDAAMDPYRSGTTLALTARPFVLRSPGPGSSNPFDYLDYVPTGHPLKDMQVRRYPFDVSFDSVRGGKVVRVTRRVSIYQVPVSQFARFSSTGIDASQANVAITSGDIYAYGDVTGSLSAASRRLWASQVEGVDQMDGSGTAAERAFNLGPVQLQSSRLGGRLSGETWSLAAPHFFGPRQQGERVAATSRPIHEPGTAKERAYDAQTFCEVLFHPQNVNAQDVTRGALTMNVFSSAGSLLGSLQGVMRGLGTGDSPGFVESLIDGSGSSLGQRANTLSISPLLAAGVDAESSMDLVAVRAGAWNFRVATTGGDTARLWVDDTLVISGSGSLQASVSLAAGVRSIRFLHRGSGGSATVFVTPPGLPEAYLTQWAVAPGTEEHLRGSFQGSVTGVESFGWRLIPAGDRSNQTGVENAALLLNLDQPWRHAAAGGDVALYCEGIRSGSSRYFTANGRDWADVLVEVRGATLHSDISSKSSFTLLSPNPVVITADLAAASYDGLYVIARRQDGEGGDAVYFGYDQGNAKSLNIAGVIGGRTIAMRSYYDRSDPIAAQFETKGAAASHSSPIFKTLVLIDDFAVQEEPR